MSDATRTNTLIRIWKEKGQIFEGIANSIFRTEHIDEISEERLKICRTCDGFDTIGTGCAVRGTQPCCNKCGCSLKLKTRALSSRCPIGKWGEEITAEEEFHLRTNLKIQ